MPYFIISGYPNCPNYGHAIVVAQYLSEHMPNFEFKQVEMAMKEWPKYLMKINKDNQWYITKSPLIWKEIHMWGGKKYLIGGLGEFWEYCYCYYGLESRIPKSELLKLAADNLKHFEEKQLAAEQKIHHKRIITIIGVPNYMMSLLLHDILEVPNLRKKEGIMFRLYDEILQNPQKKIMEDIANYYNSMNIYGDQDTVVIMSSLKEAVADCDLIIHAADFRQGADEEEELWLERCFARMNYLSDTVNSCRNRGLRIILNNYGPVCFLATCLIEFCTTVKPSNIVAVTADEGLSYIKETSERTGIPVSTITAPPAWGFIGINSFVDVRNMVYKADVYRPNLRSLTAPRGSTLPLGTIKTELRLMSYLIGEPDEIVRLVQERKKNVDYVLERPIILAKIRALTSLLKLWYAPESSDDIISLGVCSNGSFGIPAGVVFSQPAILDKKNRWAPFSRFPLMDDLSKKEINACVTTASEILSKFGLLIHYCRDDGDICSNPECPMNLKSTSWYCRSADDICSNPDCPMNIEKYVLSSAMGENSETEFQMKAQNSDPEIVLNVQNLN